MRLGTPLLNLKNFKSSCECKKVACWVKMSFYYNRKSNYKHTFLTLPLASNQNIHNLMTKRQSLKTMTNKRNLSTKWLLMRNFNHENMTFMH